MRYENHQKQQVLSRNREKQKENAKRQAHKERVERYRKAEEKRRVRLQKVREMEAKRRQDLINKQGAKERQAKRTHERQEQKRELNRAANDLRSTINRQRATRIKAEKERRRRIKVLAKIESHNQKRELIADIQYATLEERKERNRVDWIRKQELRKKRTEAQQMVSPGPGQYSVPRSGFEAKGGVAFPCRVDSHLEVMLKRAAETPGVGDYSASIQNNYDGGVQFPCTRKVMVDRVPGPGAYSPTNSSFSSKGVACFSEASTPTHLETVIKRAAESPGPADYNTSKSCFPSRSQSSPSRLFQMVGKTLKHSLRFAKAASAMSALRIKTSATPLAVADADGDDDCKTPRMLPTMDSGDDSPATPPNSPDQSKNMASTTPRRLPSVAVSPRPTQLRI